MLGMTSLAKMVSSCCFWALAIAFLILLSSLCSVCFWRISVRQSQHQHTILPIDGAADFEMFVSTLIAVTPPPSLSWLQCCHYCHHLSSFNFDMVAGLKDVLFLVGSKTWGKSNAQLIVCYINYRLIPAARSEDQAVAPRSPPLPIIQDSLPTISVRLIEAVLLYINAGCALTNPINWEKSKWLRDVSEGIVVVIPLQETKVFFMKTA